MAKKHQNGYSVEPFPKMRRFALDAGRLGRRKHIVHGLLEMDVTEALQYIRDHKARTGESLSFTAFVITCLARAVDMNKEVHAQRNWLNQLIIFDDVDINTMIEVEFGNRKVPMPTSLKPQTGKRFGRSTRRSEPRKRNQPVAQNPGLCGRFCCSRGLSDDSSIG